MIGSPDGGFFLYGFSADEESPVFVFWEKVVRRFVTIEVEADAVFGEPAIVGVWRNGVPAAERFAEKSVSVVAFIGVTDSDHLEAVSWRVPVTDGLDDSRGYVGSLVDDNEEVVFWMDTDKVGESTIDVTGFEGDGVDAVFSIFFRVLDSGRRVHGEDTGHTESFALEVEGSDVRPDTFF